MGRLLFTLATLAFSFAHADLTNLPDPAGLTQVGRVELFSTVQPLAWLMPTAFSSQMDCTQNDSGDSRTCTIKIFNALTPQEQQSIDQMAHKNNLGVVPFTDTDTQVVRDIKETFDGLPADIKVSSQSLRTLALTSGSYSYGSALFRAKKDRVEEILAAYQGSGLGNFTVNFHLNVQRTEMYLGVRDGACLKKALLASQGQWLWDVSGVLNPALQQCGLISVNYTGNEGHDYMYFHLRDTFFDFNFFSGYTLKKQALNEIGERYVLQDDKGDVQQVDCQTVLPLVQNGQPVTTCNYVHGESL